MGGRNSFRAKVQHCLNATMGRRVLCMRTAQTVQWVLWIIHMDTSTHAVSSQLAKLSAGRSILLELFPESISSQVSWIPPEPNLSSAMLGLS